MNRQATKQVVGASILIAMMAGNAQADSKLEVEKCYGVAKAGKNDCAAKDGSHNCAGLAKKDNESVSWVYVSKGVCEKLVGGKKG
jgi:uncharacterized membrane protein